MKKLLVLSLLGLAASVYAAVITTEESGKHELRERDGTVIARYDSHAACLAAAEATFALRTVPSQQYKCNNSYLITVTGVCDAPKPALPTIVDADGFTLRGELVAVLDLTDDTKVYSFVTAYVPAEYPMCWRLGLVQDQPAFEILDPPYVGFVPTLDPGALDGEKP